MTHHRIYFNGEFLPCRSSPQITLVVTFPSFGKWFVDAPIKLGVERGIEDWSASFIVFGFGLVYNKNWDYDNFGA